MPSSIFHYTDATGLLGILESQSLFATDYRYLNDSTEGREIRKLILPIFEEEVASLTRQLVQANKLKKEFYDDFGTRGHLLQAEAIYNSISRAADNISPFFVLSFCRHDEKSEQFEHGLLSQWRGYTEAGGFAIEFDEDALDKRLKGEHEKYECAVIRSSDVRYSDFEKEFDPNLYKGLAGGFFTHFFASRGLDVKDICGSKPVHDAVEPYIKAAPFLKHESFSEEREYRIVAAFNRTRKIVKGMKPAKRIEFRSRGSLIVPYVRLFESDVGHLPMKSIIVGPHPYQDRQAEALDMALEAKGIRLPIRRSAIPFRR